jgi:hypothetical protein
MIATREQALALAVQLWGPKVTVCDRGILPGYGRFTINSGTWACNDGKDKVNIWGSGRSWDEAFADARTRYKYWQLT